VAVCSSTPLIMTLPADTLYQAPDAMLLEQALPALPCRRWYALHEHMAVGLVDEHMFAPANEYTACWVTIHYQT
jgi:hypothetical protein